VTHSVRDTLARGGARLLRVRWVVRAPIWLYRARLGFLFGHRLLMLEHIGRTSGLRRYVVLEVVDRPAPNRYVVVAGFGPHAQWLRNVIAQPQVRVSAGFRGPTPATALVLDPDATAAALRRYAAAHPRAWAGLRPVLEQTLGSSIEVTGTDLPMVELDLETR
jgi:deazaflavin-dependent oxidoreductase (nitroreductase family)